MVGFTRSESIKLSVFASMDKATVHLLSNGLALNVRNIKASARFQMVLSSSFFR